MVELCNSRILVMVFPPLNMVSVIINMANNRVDQGSSIGHSFSV